jgi:hypothetical protein
MLMRYLTSSFVAVAVLACCGCNRSPENLIARQVSILDETADALATIEDEESAKAAAPTLSKLQQRLRDLIPQVKALELSTEEREALEDEHRDAMKAALEKYQTQLARVRKLELKAGGLSHLESAIAE